MSIDITSEDLTGVAVRALRCLRGFNQQMLAYDAGISLNALSRIENGKSASKPILTLIATALDSTLQDIEDLEQELTGYQHKIKNRVMNTPGWPHMQTGEGES